RDKTAAEVERRLDEFIYATNDTSLADALIRQLQERSATLAIIDQGGGGRFASLLLTSPDANSVLREGTSLPAESNNSTALADMARTAGATLGMVITVESTTGQNGLFDGNVTVSIIGGEMGVEE